MAKNPNPFETNLMRVVVAELHFLAGINAAREMYGKSYFSLGVGEKTAVDQAVLGQIGANYQLLMPELLQSQAPPREAGFQIPTTGQKRGS